MRWLGLVVLGACQFTQGALSNDARGGDDAEIDATVVSPDGPPDTTLDPAARVRLIDLVDAQITGGPHADFPLLISINATWLRPTSSGGDVARSDGVDIYFSADQAGTMRLAHEVELYTPGTGTLVAWVKIPSLVPATVLYVHCGDTAITTSQENVTAVWTGGYELAMHLDAITDATGKTTTLSSVTSGLAAGEVDQARTFDGADDRIDLGSVTAIDNIWAGGGTAEAWFNAQGWGEGSYGRFFDKGHYSGWALFLDDVAGNDAIGFVHGDGTANAGGWNTPDLSVTLNAWHHVAVVYNKDSSANVPVIFIDGMSVGVTQVLAPTGTMDSDAAIDLYVGNRSSLDRTWDGQLDEMRLSSVPRSADWIVTGYRNQVDPASFYTISMPL